MHYFRVSKLDKKWLYILKETTWQWIERLNKKTLLKIHELKKYLIFRYDMNLDTMQSTSSRSYNFWILQTCFFQNLLKMFISIKIWLDSMFWNRQVLVSWAKNLAPIKNWQSTSMHKPFILVFFRAHFHLNITNLAQNCSISSQFSVRKVPDNTLRIIS